MVITMLNDGPKRSECFSFIYLEECTIFNLENIIFYKIFIYS